MSLPAAAGPAAHLTHEEMELPGCAADSPQCSLPGTCSTALLARAQGWSYVVQSLRIPQGSGAAFGRVFLTWERPRLEL